MLYDLNFLGRYTEEYGLFDLQSLLAKLVLYAHLSFLIILLYPPSPYSTRSGREWE